RYAGCTPEPKPRNLHRCRPASEHQQPVSLRMAREIDQYIDTIRDDLRCGGFILQANLALPMMGRAAQLCRHAIDDATVAVTVYFNCARVVVRKYLVQKITDWMVGEIRRYIADTKLTARLSGIHERAQGFRPDLIR